MSTDSIFRLDQQGKIMLVPDAIGLCPEFSLLESDQIVYLVCAYDSMNTIFKQQPRKNWKTLAAKHVFGTSADFEFAENQITKPAIDRFKELVFDEQREWKHTLLEKIEKLNIAFLAEDDSKRQSNIVAARKQTMQLIEEADEKISIVDEKVRLALKNGKLSYLEICQIRWRKFE
jgi:hypothetical protein